MKLYFIKFKTILGKDYRQSELQSTSIEAKSVNSAITKLERKEKKTWGLAYMGIKVFDVSVLGYY